MSRRRRPCNGAEVVHRPCPTAHSSAALHLQRAALHLYTAAHAPSPGAGVDIISPRRCILCE